MDSDGISIQQIVERTGVPEGTLRMWERRHGFPAPRRLPSGHRRYSPADVELVQRVARDREAGLTLATAIARTSAVAAAAPPSVYATLRRDHPELEPRALPKPVLLAFTHAIEDEGLARAQSGLIFATFQAERFYRQSEARWRQLSRSAQLAIAFADFAELRTPPDGAIEVPIPADCPLRREWTLVIWAPGHTVCLSAWQPPPRTREARDPPIFEAIWSVEPRVVHCAASVCANLASTRVPSLGPPLRAALRPDPGPPADHQLQLAAAITSRTLSYLS